MSDSICIVGGGSIGSILAYYLYRGGVGEITVFYRSRESIEAVERNGGLTVFYGGREYLVPVKPLSYSNSFTKCGFVLSAVKAYDVPETIDLLKKVSYRDTLIVMFQNGFGSLELAEEVLAGNPVAGAVVFIGAERRARHLVVHHGGNTIYAGCRRGLCLELGELRELFVRGGCDFRVVSNIDFYRWLKLGLNAVVNPVTAIARARNRVVLTEAGRTLARAILEEVVEAAKRSGVELDLEKLYDMVMRSVASVADNYSSMAQDVLSGRRTEVDFINGYIARILGSRSINWVLTQLVHLIEEAGRERHVY